MDISASLRLKYNPYLQGCIGAESADAYCGDRRHQEGCKIAHVSARSKGKKNPVKGEFGTYGDGETAYEGEGKR